MDVHVTPGNVSDSEPILKRIDRIEETFNIKPKYLGLDAGYSTNPIFKGITDRDIIPVIAYRRSPHKKGMYTKNKYIYDYDKDIYICPNNVALIYKTTTREGYKEYRCFEEICMCCPHKDKCLGEKSKYKIIRRHVWENHKDDNKNFLKTEKGKAIYDRRKETVERSFADSKNLHGLRYARFRGHEKVSEQCLLTAAVQNMKKIATRLSLLFSYYIIKFYNIFNIKFYPQLIIEKPSVFKQGVFQQTGIKMVGITDHFYLIYFTILLTVIHNSVSMCIY